MRKPRFIKKIVYNFEWLKQKGIRNGECLEWQGGTCRGYGVCGRPSRRINRLVCTEFYGKSDKFACHSCDNPLCFEPKHLFWGTNKENMEDASRKRRIPRGEKNYKSKLDNSTAEAIRLIYPLGFSQSQLALLYDISQTGIGRILRYKTYAL